VSFPPPADNHCIIKSSRRPGHGLRGARIDANADAHQRNEFKHPRFPPSTPKKPELAG